MFVRGVVRLEQNCQSTHQDFFHGSFVTQKTCHKFSAHDHVHEQLNTIVKGEGGEFGLTENESAQKSLGCSLDTCMNSDS